MSKKTVAIIISIIILILLASKFLIHTKCKGTEGIPWWPNSGCDCKGILISNSRQGDLVGGGAAYCIGLLHEYTTK